ncbi:hypothetical protein HJC23_004894 [Cyclotella cryptica]|uniref:Uncharacterized protein n=1 Tax=Cyclotella cryptica TaxID=29204 RepID=A0ABD3P3T9_9STRA
MAIENKGRVTAGTGNNCLGGGRRNEGQGSTTREATKGENTPLGVPSKPTMSLYLSCNSLTQQSRPNDDEEDDLPRCSIH